MSPSRISLPINFNSVCAVCALMLVYSLLLVVGHDGLEKILEPFVPADVVLARDLEEELFELVQAAQAVARDGVGQSRAQHDKFVLAFTFRRADGTPHRAVEAAQLALGAGIHVAHAAHDRVRLIIQVEAVADELFELDFGRTFGTSAVEAARSAISTVAARSAISAAGPVAARSTISAGSAAAATRTVAARSAFFLRLLWLLVSHFVLRTA